MENKINIAELLKDCPKGMELDCTLFDDVKFETVENNSICIRLNNGESFTLSPYGNCIGLTISKCVIFPKGKTTWEGFVPPWKFNDGDIVSTINGYFIGIFKYMDDTMGDFCYCASNKIGSLSINAFLYFDRLATEEEKQKLFDAIKANGYKWNAETKTLEKLIEPKFKVGDKVQEKNGYVSGKIIGIVDNKYDVQVDGSKGLYVPIIEEDDWELIPNKFDITTLVPFESKVLVRNSDSGFWKPAFWGIYEAEKSNEHQYRNYLTTEGFVRHCIPYNDETKHLVGKTSDCAEFYKTWEE